MASNEPRKFVVGDRVRCINNDGVMDDLRCGHVYLVASPIHDHRCIQLVERFPHWFMVDRFVLADEQPVASSPVVPGIVHLPTDAKARKAAPICTGVLDYFPDAIADVARLSKIGNDQHNPGEPMHWARGKSMDQADCILRHQMDRGTVDTDGVLHDTKVAWRALAQLQLAIEAQRAKGSYP